MIHLSSRKRMFVYEEYTKQLLYKKVLLIEIIVGKYAGNRLIICHDLETATKFL